MCLHLGWMMANITKYSALEFMRLLLRLFVILKIKFSIRNTSMKILSEYISIFLVVLLGASSSFSMESPVTA